MRLIVAVFVLGEDMEDMEDVLKLCLGLWWEVFRLDFQPLFGKMSPHSSECKEVF